MGDGYFTLQSLFKVIHDVIFITTLKFRAGNNKEVNMLYENILVCRLNFLW